MKNELILEFDNEHTAAMFGTDLINTQQSSKQWEQTDEETHSETHRDEHTLPSTEHQTNRGDISEHWTLTLSLYPFVSCGFSLNFIKVNRVNYFTNVIEKQCDTVPICAAGI